MNQGMTLPRDIELLVDFASQVNRRKHPYVQMSDEQGFTLVSPNGKHCPKDLNDLIERCLFHVQNRSQRGATRALDAALLQIEEYLKSKIQWARWVLLGKDAPASRGLLAKVQWFRSHLKNPALKGSWIEATARLHYLSDSKWNPLKSAASPAELQVLRLLSQVAWKASLQKMDGYCILMDQVFKGTPLLIPSSKQGLQFQDIVSVPHQTYPVQKRTCKHKASYRRLVEGPLLGAVGFGRMHSDDHGNAVTWICKTDAPKKARLGNIFWAHFKGYFVRKECPDPISIEVALEESAD